MYQALYRKWRPRSFEDVVSQPHITTTLINQVRANKTAHAYLFTGSRGTGKTTCARIFAKAVNCENLVDGEPCLECELCKAMESPAFSDIIEIDAASNNGVEDIRELREGAIYTPERCKYKIYIIDEVHMLSVNAFNALLKIMEEPPAYVKFILATTEVHKVPPTIASRCQRFDFRRIRSEDISNRLLYIAGEEGLTLHEDASQLIARLSDGGMRDALSLLDQCSAYSINGDEIEPITTLTVSNATGIASGQHTFKLIDAMFNKNVAECLSVIDSLYSMSKDMQRLCQEILSQLRNLMMLKVSPQNTELIVCMPEELEILKGLSRQIDVNGILDYLSVFQSLNDKLPRCLNKRIEIEMCLIKLCSVKETPKGLDNSQIYDKINKLEDMFKQGTINQNVSRTPKVIQPEKPKPKEEEIDFSKLSVEDFKKVGNWSEVLDEFFKVNPSVSGTLVESEAYVNQNVMLIIVKNSFFLNLFRNRENAISLGDVITKVLGKSYKIRAKCNGGTNSQQGSAAMRMIKKAEQNNIDTEIKNN